MIKFFIVNVVDSGKMAFLLFRFAKYTMYLCVCGMVVLVLLRGKLFERLTIVNECRLNIHNLVLVLLVVLVLLEATQIIRILYLIFHLDSINSASTINQHMDQQNADALLYILNKVRKNYIKFYFLSRSQTDCP